LRPTFNGKLLLFGLIFFLNVFCFGKENI